MRNTDGRGLVALGVIVAVLVVIVLAMMWASRQPRMTPAGATGSMQGQLSPRTDPKR